MFLAPHAEFYHLHEKHDAMAPGKPNPFIDPDGFQTAVKEMDIAFHKELAKQKVTAK